MAPKLLTLVLSIIFFLALMGIFWMMYAVKAKSSKNGSVVAYRKICARIGGNILKTKGSVVDSAIATLVCEGVHQPQKMGIGGGFLALVYTKASESSEALIALEGVPSQVKAEMFANGSGRDELTIAVPAEIRGYSALHQKYGRLKWADLLRPSIRILEKGYQVDEDLANDLKENEKGILKVASLREIFVNRSTGKVFNKGDVIQDYLLAETLKVVARNGESAIYHGGSVGKNLIADVRNFGGILTEDDLRKYKLHWNRNLKAQYLNYTIHSLPVLGGDELMKHIRNKTLLQPGPIDFIMNEPEHYRMILPIIPELPERKLFPNYSYKRHIKFQRFQDGKTFNVLEYYSDSGSQTSHDYAVGFVAVIAPTGDAIAVTSSLYSRFGSMRRSRRTGILLNDLMRDSYFRNPDKSRSSKSTPQFSIYPTIITDVNGYPKMILSSCGGEKATYLLAKIVRNNLGGAHKERPVLFSSKRRL